MNWCVLEECCESRLERAEVDGGWLYRASVFRTSWDRAIQRDVEETLSQSIAFAPVLPPPPSGDRAP
jgi:hypothetical protein